jgi:CopG family transcriptional regulator, nickel-responsive regulator
MDKCIRFGVSLPEKLLVCFDRDIEKKGYANRSEAIRDLIRQSLVESEWNDSKSETAAAVVLVYDHHKRGLTAHLTNVQHEYHENIISTMHAHLDHDNCIEVVLLRGIAKVVKPIADKLASAKHVKHGKFVPTTLGKEL